MSPAALENLVNVHEERLDHLHERQKEDRAEIRDFRKESSDRSFTLVMFAIGQLVALVGGMAALLYTLGKR